MRTKKYAKLHNRCSQILELIERAESMELSNKNALNYQSKLRYVDQNDYLISQYQIAVQKYKAIKERLISWYADCMLRLNSEVFEWMEKKIEAESSLPKLPKYCKDAFGRNRDIKISN